MCLGGSSKAQRRAAEAQTRALEQMAQAQKAKVKETVSKTNQTVKTNKEAKKRDMSTLRIPLTNPVNNYNHDNIYGLNIPL